MTSVANVDRRRAAPTLGTFERYQTVWVALCIVAGMCSGSCCRHRFTRSAA